MNVIRPEYTLAAISGFLSHLLYFSRGESDYHALAIAKSVVFLLTSLAVYHLAAYGLSASCLAHFVLTVSAFLVSLFSSVLIFRLFFHNLRDFPGPFWAKVSKLYAVYMARNGIYISEMNRLHSEYGPFVRIGKLLLLHVHHRYACIDFLPAPNELSINTVDAFLEVHGSQSKCTKSSGYSTTGCRGQFSVAFTAEKAVHKERRRIWNHAFSMKSLVAYDERVEQIIQDWVTQINSQQGEAMDLNHWALLMTFDMMGSVGFSQDWGVVRDGRENTTLKLLGNALAPTAKFGDLMWPLKLLSDLEISKEMNAFRAWSAQVMAARRQAEPTKPDLAGPLLDSYNASAQTWKDDALLQVEGESIILAATHTTANTIVWIFYHAARDQDLQSRLWDEVKPLFDENEEGDEVLTNKLAKLPLLNAVIDELLRLYPSVAHIGGRVTPPEGIQVNETHIPGGVIVQAQPYCLHRNPEYFERPDDFIPERWTSRSELVKDKRAFVPFLIGQRSCVGKQLALVEVRKVFVNTLRHFRVAFAPEQDTANYEQSWQDFIFFSPAKLCLVFHKRD